MFDGVARLGVEMCACSLQACVPAGHLSLETCNASILRPSVIRDIHSCKTPRQHSAPSSSLLMRSPGNVGACMCATSNPAPVDCVRNAMEARMWQRARTAASLLLLVFAASTVEAVKLKIRYSECITHHFDMYEPFYGSFVALPDVYYYTASYQLVVTSPSGTRVHESHSSTENKFHLVPYETGRYKFCLTLADSHHGRYISEREVVWDLFVGHADHMSDHAKENDAQSLWHYVHMVDAQLQQLRSTMSYLYWRERRHRTTVDSTNKRVVWWAVARAAALVLVSVAQVLGIRYLFRSK